MPGVQFTKDDVEKAKEFILQYLRDSGYSGSLEDGTAVYDVLIKGFSLLYAMFEQQANKASGYLSLAKAEEYKDILGDEYATAVDAILSNWFVTRKEGSPTSGVLRLWFSKPSDFLHFTTSEADFKYNESLFTVDKEYVFTEQDFTLVINKPQNKEEYYVDVDVSSNDNTYLPIKAAETFNTYINNIYFIRAEALNDFIPGIDKENSEEFIERTKKAITTRELITDRAIYTVLLEEFDDVESVYVAGHGAPEQLRDVVEFENTQVHVGNKADIYVYSKMFKLIGSYTLEEDGVVYISGISNYTGHISDILKVNRGDEVLDFEIDVYEHDWLSNEADIKIMVPGAVTGDQLDITYIYNPTIGKVQDFIYSDLNRVTCYDPLVKSMHPIILSFDLTLDAKPEYDSDLLISDTKKAIAGYIQSLDFKTPYTESLFIQYLHNNVKGFDQIMLPIQVSYRLFDEKNKLVLTGQCGSKFSLPVTADMSKQITDDSVKFYTDIDFITVNLLDS